MESYPRPSHFMFSKSEPGQQYLERIIRHDRIHRTNQVSLGAAFYEEGGLCGPRIQDCYELIIIHQGAVDILLDGRPIHVEEGQVTLLKPGPLELMQFSKSTPTHQSWCLLRAELMPPRLVSRVPWMEQVINTSPSLLAIMDLALSLPLPLGKMEEMLIEQLAVSTFFEFGRQAMPPELNSDILPEALRLSIEFIEQNYGKYLTLPELAKSSKVTPHHLIKLFRKHLNATPMDYLWKLRTRRGAELLRTTGFNISQIAFRVGFQSQFHFSRVFRKEFLVSPKEFRNKLWGQQNIPSHQREEIMTRAKRKMSQVAKKSDAARTRAASAGTGSEEPPPKKKARKPRGRPPKRRSK